MGIILPIYKNFMSHSLRFCFLPLVLLPMLAHADSQVTDDSFSACPKHFADNQAPRPRRCAFRALRCYILGCLVHRFGQRNI